MKQTKLIALCLMAFFMVCCSESGIDETITDSPEEQLSDDSEDSDTDEQEEQTTDSPEEPDTDEQEEQTTDSPEEPDTDEQEEQTTDPDSTDEEDTIESADLPWAFPNETSEEVTIYMGEAAITVDKYGDTYVLQGDIILDESQFSLSETKGAVKTTVNYWEDGKVFYQLDSNMSSFKDKITSAVSYINNCGAQARFISLDDADLTDQEKKLFENKLLTFCESTDPFSLGYSDLGKISSNEVRLGTEAGEKTIIHELGHTLGMFHEHCRGDRYKYIKVNKSNIDIAKYRIHNWDSIPLSSSIYSDAFDFKSIMIYQPKAGGKKVNGVQLTVLEPLDATNTIEPSSVFTSNDIIAINKAYNYTKFGAEVIIQEDQSSITSSSITLIQKIIYEGDPIFSNVGYTISPYHEGITTSSSTTSNIRTTIIQNLNPDTEYTIKNAYTIYVNDDQRVSMYYNNDVISETNPITFTTLSNTVEGELSDLDEVEL